MQRVQSVVFMPSAAALHSRALLATPPPPPCAHLSHEGLQLRHQVGGRHQPLDGVVALTQHIQVHHGPQEPQAQQALALQVPEATRLNKGMEAGQQ